MEYGAKLCCEKGNSEPLKTMEHIQVAEKMAHEIVNSYPDEQQNDMIVRIIEVVKNERIERLKQAENTFGNIKSSMGIFESIKF